MLRRRRNVAVMSVSTETVSSAVLGRLEVLPVLQPAPLRSADVLPVVGLVVVVVVVATILAFLVDALVLAEWRKGGAVVHIIL